MAINKTDFSSTQQVYDSTWTTPTKKTGPTTTDLPEQQRKAGRHAAPGKHARH